MMLRESRNLCAHMKPTSTNEYSSFQEIVGYLERQYDDILAEQSRIRRNPRFRDNRVHALLYFIPPTGHAYVAPVFFQLPIH